MKGSRVQNVVQELRGEKIDIIPWHVDAAKFVCNALAPADISRVIIDEENRAMDVIVPDEFLFPWPSAKRGQNVRLASKLTGWHLDVKSESIYNQDMKDGYDSLMALPEHDGGSCGCALRERILFRSRSGGMFRGGSGAGERPFRGRCSGPGGKGKGIRPCQGACRTQKAASDEASSEVEEASPETDEVSSKAERLLPRRMSFSQSGRGFS